MDTKYKLLIAFFIFVCIVVALSFYNNSQTVPVITPPPAITPPAVKKILDFSDYPDLSEYQDIDIPTVSTSTPADLALDNAALAASSVAAKIADDAAKAAAKAAVDAAKAAAASAEDAAEAAKVAAKTAEEAASAAAKTATDAAKASENAAKSAAAAKEAAAKSSDAALAAAAKAAENAAKAAAKTAEDAAKAAAKASEDATAAVEEAEVAAKTAEDASDDLAAAEEEEVDNWVPPPLVIEKVVYDEPIKAPEVIMATDKLLRPADITYTSPQPIFTANQKMAISLVVDPFLIYGILTSKLAKRLALAAEIAAMKATQYLLLKFIGKAGERLLFILGALVGKKAIAIFEKIIAQRIAIQVAKQVAQKVATSAAVAAVTGPAALAVFGLEMAFMALTIGLDIGDAGGYGRMTTNNMFIDAKKDNDKEFYDAFKDQGLSDTQIPIIKGPWFIENMHKKSPEETKKILSDGMIKLFKQKSPLVTPLADAILAKINEGKLAMQDLDDAEMERFLAPDKITGKTLFSQKDLDKCLEEIMKMDCYAKNGKIVKRNEIDYCSYVDKASCESSYSWPLIQEDTDKIPKDSYAEFRTYPVLGSICVLASPVIRISCDEIELNYDTASGLCKTTEKYCKTKGADWKDNDCHISGGQEMLEMILGTTITRGLKQVFDLGQYETCVDPEYEAPAGLSISMLTFWIRYFCYKTECKPGEYLFASSCYPNCIEGYHPVGGNWCYPNTHGLPIAKIRSSCPTGYHMSVAGMCMEDCPPGYQMGGGLCYKSCKSGEAPTNEDENGKKAEVEVGALCREPCPPGHRDIAAVCWPDCPAGKRDDGTACWVDSHTYLRTKTCPPGYSNISNGIYCYKDCPSDYTSFSYTCTKADGGTISKPKANMWYGDCPAGTRTEPVSCMRDAHDYEKPKTCPAGYTMRAGTTCTKDGCPAYYNEHDFTCTGGGHDYWKDRTDVNYAPCPSGFHQTAYMCTGGKPETKLKEGNCCHDPYNSSWCRAEKCGDWQGKQGFREDPCACWIDSVRPRDASCPAGFSQNGAYCYRNDCPDGYVNNSYSCNRAVGTINKVQEPVTRQPCPDPYVDSLFGTWCSKVAKSTLRPKLCPAEYSHKDLLECYKDECPSGWTEFPLTCTKHITFDTILKDKVLATFNACPEGYRTDPLTCHRDAKVEYKQSKIPRTYLRNIAPTPISKPASCASNEVDVDTLCYEKCQPNYVMKTLGICTYKGANAYGNGVGRITGSMRPKKRIIPFSTKSN